MTVQFDVEEQNNAEGVGQFQPQGWSASDNPGNAIQNKKTNPERVRRAMNPFRVVRLFLTLFTQGSRCARTLG
jgi:hypothetical protein